MTSLTTERVYVCVCVINVVCMYVKMADCDLDKKLYTFYSLCHCGHVLLYVCAWKLQEVVPLARHLFLEPPRISLSYLPPRELWRTEAAAACMHEAVQGSRRHKYALNMKHAVLEEIVEMSSGQLDPQKRQRE